MWAFSRRRIIQIRRNIWKTMVRQLEIRGGGVRESGAFLLGRPRRRHPLVTHVVYFDDLEPGSLNGAVHLTLVAYSRLWALCSELGVEVLGDVHTHPGDIVAQSKIDQDNPLVARAGHIALIVPRFAKGRIKPADVAAYEYLGDDGWRNRPGGVRHWRWF
jgi:proteasome lid subunit RPN8/RPN11